MSLRSISVLMTGSGARHVPARQRRISQFLRKPCGGSRRTHSECMTSASELMAGFVARDQRYLWTDAFAVCNFIGLGQTERAIAIVDRVHDALGVAKDKAHPTRAGVRIGKPLPERGPREPFDERLEWD